METEHLKGKITVTVDPPSLVGSATKHHEYHIHGSDDVGQIDISRRYSDFIILKQHMMNRWPGVYIPSLPEKKFIGNNQSDFLSIRRQGLESFIFLISQNNYLWYSDEFQLFIKSKSNQVDKFLTNLGKTSLRQILMKYQSKFATILESSQLQKSAQENSIKVNQFKVYLRNVLVVLQKLSKVSEIMAETRRRFNEKYMNLLQTVLPQYQQKCTSFYTQDDQSLIFANYKNNGLVDIQVNMPKIIGKNSLAIVNQLIKQQIREINNFQQILKNRQQYQGIKLKAMGKARDLQLEQSKINAGKQSIMNKIKKASKQQQLQQNKVQLMKSKQQLKQAEQLCRVLDKILADDQIGKFKQTRSKMYYCITKEMAKAEKQNCQIQGQFWSKIAGGQGFMVQSYEHEKKVQDQQDKLIKIQNAEFLDDKIEKQTEHQYIETNYKTEKKQQQQQIQQKRQEQSQQKNNGHEEIDD